MSWSALLFKDVREHGLSLGLLCTGFLVTILLIQLQLAQAQFSMSLLESIRLALLSIVPLTTFIVGNRLIVKEYLGGTQKFVESLPVGRMLPLLLKYFTGLFYLLLLSSLLLAMVFMSAAAVEYMDRRYVLLITTKTLAIVLLYWSLVFFLSLCGKIRLVLYVLIGSVLLFIINNPSIDELRFPPIALLERELFLFERVVFPWTHIVLTVLIAIALAALGFFLALLNEGSIVERLSKPMSKRDMAALVLLCMASLTIHGALQESWQQESYTFSSDAVVRMDEPRVSVQYLEPPYRDSAERLLQQTGTALLELQSGIGLAALPHVRIAMDAERDVDDIDVQLDDGVTVTANFSGLDSFDRAWIVTIALHHTLLSLTNGRMDYETRHWLLDGFARWWAEGSTRAPGSSHNAELLSLAVFAESRLPANMLILSSWQSVMDRVGFELADALAYTAMLYLHETGNEQAVVKLARYYLNLPVGSSSLQSLKRLFMNEAHQFETLTGIAFDAFEPAWRQWLKQQAPALQDYLSAIPAIDPVVSSVVDSNGVHRIDVSYLAQSGLSAMPPGQCVFRHQLTPAFDIETAIYTRERDRATCTLDGVVHSAGSRYAPGDRIYAQVEFETQQFHRPVVLWIGRIDVQ